MELLSGAPLCVIQGRPVLVLGGDLFSFFFEICKKVQSATEADIQPFIQVLLAASDYMLFADIMLGGTEKRKYFVSILVGLQADFRRELGDSS